MYETNDSPSDLEAPQAESPEALIMIEHVAGALDHRPGCYVSANHCSIRSALQKQYNIDRDKAQFCKLYIAAAKTLPPFGFQLFESPVRGALRTHLVGPTLYLPFATFRKKYNIVGGYYSCEWNNNLQMFIATKGADLP